MHWRPSKWIESTRPVMLNLTLGGSVPFTIVGKHSWVGLGLAQPFKFLLLLLLFILYYLSLYTIYLCPLITQSPPPRPLPYSGISCILIGHLLGSTLTAITVLLFAITVLLFTLSSFVDFEVTQKIILNEITNFSLTLFLQIFGNAAFIKLKVPWHLVCASYMISIFHLQRLQL